MIAAKRKSIIIIGAGMAGSKLASALLERNGSDYDITLIGEEAQAGYNRIMLSSLLANEITEKDMALVDTQAMTNDGVTVITNDPVVEVCTQQRQVKLASNQIIIYDKLIFATGSRASMLPIEGCDATNVMGFRNWQDVQAMAELPEKSSVCVIGGGLLGLEAAVGLIKRGHNVVLVHRSEHILNRQLDVAAANLLQKTLEDRGVEFRLGFAPTKLLVTQPAAKSNAIKVHSVCLASGEMISTSLVIMATGITPEVTLANKAGLDIGRAITVNRFMESSIENIYALGECCEFEGNTFGLVAPIWQQLDTLINRINGVDSGFNVEPIPTKLKVSGINLFSVGDINPQGNAHCITFMDSAQNSYRKLVVNDGKLTAAILYGNVADGSWYFQLIQNKTHIRDQLDQLVFGEAYCQIKNDQVKANNIKVA